MNPPPLDSEDEIRRSHFANQQQCLAAFNKADVKAFEECLDPDVTLFTPEGEARGRKAMVDYVSALYFSQRPLPRLEMKMRSVRILGTVLNRYLPGKAGEGKHYYYYQYQSYGETDERSSGDSAA